MIIVTNDDRMGKNIRYLRQKQNLSQKALAESVGTACSVLDAIEQGTLLELDAQVFDKICKRFQTDIKTLVEEEIH